MPATTPTPTLFQDAYLGATAPWVIGEPQPAVVDLERRGALSGSVLDIGCGAGEHTMLLAGLGYDVLGVDAAAAAVEQARAAAARRGLDARFAVADALHPEGLRGFDTVLDSALFHIFAAEDRHAYVEALGRVVVVGGRVLVLALAVEGGWGFGPEVRRDDIVGAFTAPGWELEGLETTSYRGRIVTAEQSEQYGLPVGARVDPAAWLATVRRR